MSLSWPAPLETLTIRPAGLLSRCGTNACDTLNAPSALVAMVRATTSGLMVRISWSPSEMMAALLINTFSAGTALAARATLESSVISSSRNEAFFSLAAAAELWFHRRAVTITFQARAESCRATS